jgi:hypothetical protein
MSSAIGLLLVYRRSTRGMIIGAFSAFSCSPAPSRTSRLLIASLGLACSLSTMLRSFSRAVCDVLGGAAGGGNVFGRVVGRWVEVLLDFSDYLDML